eukprot:TRINITY_DN4741_c0_g1_i1.p1 TRINITY_DN4741_c0_g1~~TRINITY_DN4741_c0_g1_i1.p1  ORF type:complete len:85 (-),score=13.01 TRINITY_DN4741_c0_g1_i1:204-458(-)
MECGADVKQSKVKPGQFWKHCSAKSGECECMSSWIWKDQTFTGCAPEHPDSKSPWCYVSGGLECGAGVKESKVSPGMFWRHCGY